MSCDELELLMGSDPVSAGKADFVTESAPASWAAYSDSTRSSVDWLYSWQKYASTFLIAHEGLVSAFSGILSTNAIDGIVSSVQTAGGSCEDTVALAGKLVHMQLVNNENAVCRHHAADLKKVLRKLDVARVNVEAGLTFEGYAPIGHAWVEASCGPAKIVADAYNRIYVRVE